MSGDYSRWGFNPRANYASVLLQQGRPLLDRDWNELAQAVERRQQALALDTHGPFTVSAVSPDAFAITADGGRLLIGRGRAYLDGLLVENHGTGATTWDPLLGEECGSQAVPFEKQPFRIGTAPVPTTGRPLLVYLDVWYREVTHLTDPNLVDAAIGVDTTTRLQSVWQVKLEPLDAADTCASIGDSHPAWQTLVAPSAGRLSISTATVPGDANPCLAPPAASYKGLENQLYRVEIHTPGPLGAATFKWSRDNGSVAARVTHVSDPTHVVVESLGSDDVLRFSEGDWIELVDDALELANAPGVMLQIAADGGVDEATRVLTLTTPVPANTFPADPQGRLDAARHTRIRRWDQNGTIRNAAGDVVADLSAPDSGGIVTIPAGGGTFLLENGIVARFSTADGGGRFHQGDHWIFAARAADASVDVMDAARPRGIHHHYAKLGIYRPGPSPTVDDCRLKPLTLAGLAERVKRVEVALAPRFHAPEDQFSPREGRRGVTPVDINGAQFMVGKTTVTIGGKQAGIIHSTVGLLRVLVPPDAATGPTKITVENPFGTVTSDDTFNVNP
jgi:hypothetical protein